MNLMVKIFITVLVLALNVLLYEKHNNGALHILQLIIEISGLSLFSYFLIKLDAPHKIKLVIGALLFIIFKSLSIVFFKYMSDYYPTFIEKYESYMVLVIFAVTILVYLGIERERRKRPIADFNLKR